MKSYWVVTWVLMLLMAAHGALARGVQEDFRDGDPGDEVSRSDQQQQQQQQQQLKRLTDLVVGDLPDPDRRNSADHAPPGVGNARDGSGKQKQGFRPERALDSNDVGAGDPDSGLDQIVDFLLGAADEVVASRGEAQIAVPDMSEEFEKRVAFVTLRGRFEAQQGWFRNLSTARRTGEVTAARRGLDAVVVAAEFGLAEVEFGFERYRAELAGVSVSGRMTGSVARNSASVRLAASFRGGRCAAALEQVSVDAFDGVDVQLTGLGDLSWLLDSVAGWAARHFRREIEAAIQDNLRTAIAGVLAKLPCGALRDQAPAPEPVVLV